MRRLVLLALAVLILAHNAWWVWGREGLVGGLPVGLVWEIAYCVMAVAVLAAAVRFAWPQGLDEGSEE